MVRELMHDPVFLAQKSTTATAEDLPVAQDLLDTLTFHKEGCVGMAANMIGVTKRIIVFDNEGSYMTMLNPVILKGAELYETEDLGDVQVHLGVIHDNGVQTAGVLGNQILSTLALEEGQPGLVDGVGDGGDGGHVILGAGLIAQLQHTVQVIGLVGHGTADGQAGGALWKPLSMVTA